MNNTEHSVRFSVTLVTTHFDVFQRVVGSQFSNDIFVPFLLGIFSTFENKVGVSVGITQKLTDKYDAVDLVKEAAEILGGKGGGGRKDFAQAGGIYKDKIEEAFKALSIKIN